jgi:hypothetical protein
VGALPVWAVPFVQKGLLDPGDYSMNFTDLRNSVLVKGPSNRKDPWDSAWRLKLVNNLEILVNELWEVNVTDIYIDGSFVTNKPHPNDIDGYFNCDLMHLSSGDLQRDLNKLDPYKIWTWSVRQPAPGFTKLQLPMWHAYRVELYPEFGQMFAPGVVDEFGHPLTFPAAFRKTRYTNEPKGIIKIEK